jgi:hypothetical protein
MNDKTVGGKLFFVLQLYCTCALILISLLACFLSVILVFIHSGTFYFNWIGDLIYSIKAGLASGIPSGIGIWFMLWMKEHKKNLHEIIFNL